MKVCLKVTLKMIVDTDINNVDDIMDNITIDACGNDDGSVDVYDNIVEDYEVTDVK